jgi:hypothetical protein
LSSGAPAATETLFPIWAVALLAANITTIAPIAAHTMKRRMPHLR